MGSPDIDERMAELADDDWSLLWHVAEPAPFTGACSGFSVGPLTQSECREFLARLREKLDGLSPGQLKSLVTCAKRPSRVLHGARLASLGFVDDGVAMGDGIYRAIRFQGRAALRLEVSDV